MMKNHKQLRVNVLKIAIESEKNQQSLKGDSLLAFLNSIKTLPLDIADNNNTRYTKPGSNEERTIIFSNELTSNLIIEENLQSGLFIKRRGKNRPFKEDGKGNLDKLILNQKNHELAEIAYFTIDIKSGILFWSSNHFVGGVNQLKTFLNDKYYLSKNLGKNLIDITLFNAPAMVNFFYINYPQSKKDFEEKMKIINNFEFNIAGGSEELAQQFLEESGSDREGMELIRAFVNKSNCAKLSISISSQPVKNKRKEKNRGISLNKEFIIRFYEQTIDYLKGKSRSKFIVKGIMIDEQTRILDLINYRLYYPLDIYYETEQLPFDSVIEQISNLAKNKIEEVNSFCEDNSNGKK